MIRRVDCPVVSPRMRFGERPERTLVKWSSSASITAVRLPNEPAFCTRPCEAQLDPEARAAVL